MTEPKLHTINMPGVSSSALMAEVLQRLIQEGLPKVQVLVPRGDGLKTINKCRVALSRSRGRNRARAKKVMHFTLNHSIYPYTDLEGRRFDALVLSIQKRRLHRALEVIDDILARDQTAGGITNVA